MAAAHARPIGPTSIKRSPADEHRRSGVSCVGPALTPRLAATQKDRLIRRSARPSQSGTRPIGLAGVIEIGLVASLLQMWAQSAATGTLHLEAHGMDGEIDLEAGEIVSARLGSYLGRAACFRALSLEEGQFRYQRGEPLNPPSSEQRAAARTNLHCLLLSWISLSGDGDTTSDIEDAF